MHQDYDYLLSRMRNNFPRYAWGYEYTRLILPHLLVTAYSG